MRTNIAIDDSLMDEAKKLSGIATKKGVVEASLRLFIQLQKQAALRDLRGTLRWDGDLEELRRDR